MSSIDDIISVTITANSRTPSKKGFKTPLLLAYHTHNTDLVREYSDLSEMTDDGFSEDEAGYLMVQAAFMQKPRPKTVKVGRLTTAVAQVIRLTVTTATQGKIISLNIRDSSGVDHAISRTVPGSSSLAAEATAVAALIAAVSGVASATPSSANITVTLTATGACWYFEDLANLSYLDQTTNASVDDDLTALIAVDGDFYGIDCQYKSKTNIDDIALWCATRKYIHVAYTADTAELSSSAIFTALEAAEYDRSIPLFSRDVRSWPGSAWLGACLPFDPGVQHINWAYKELKGVSADALTTTQIAYLKTFNANWYEEIASLGVTREGKVASGLFIDDIVGTDALEADMMERVFALIASLPKVPYTDAGIAMVAAEMRASLKKFVRSNFLDPGNGDDVDPPLVTTPKVSDIDATDRQNRLLPDMRFSARKAGAVNTVAINGVLSI